MNDLLGEATKKLITSDPQYVRDALIVISDQFEEMSDGGVDSLYAEPARRWRSLMFDVESVDSKPSKSVQEVFDEDDLVMVAAGILWYEVNT